MGIILEWATRGNEGVPDKKQSPSALLLSIGASLKWAMKMDGRLSWIRMNLKLSKYPVVRLSQCQDVPMSECLVKNLDNPFLA